MRVIRFIFDRCVKVLDETTKRFGKCLRSKALSLGLHRLTKSVTGGWHRCLCPPRCRVYVLRTYVRSLFFEALECRTC